MTAAVTRELSVIYGTLTTGGTTDRLIDGKVRIERSYERTSVEWDFVTTASSEANFATECAAVEAALRTPRQRLRVLLGSATLLDLNPSGNTGFNAAPSVSKRGDAADTARSRRYTARVEVQMPADLSGQAGRRDSSVGVSYNVGRRRTLELSGEYSALSGVEGRAQYEAQIDAYVTTLTTALGGSWSLVQDEHAAADDAGKNLTFRRTYRERYADGLVEADVDVSYNVGRRRTLSARGFYVGTTARAQYEANIDAYISTLTTALGGAWSLVQGETAAADDADRRCNFTRTYHEIYSDRLQASTIELSFTPARRRSVRIAGRYLASASVTARAQYEASIAAYAASVLNSIGGTYELVEESAGADDANREIRFSRLYEEIVYGQSGGTDDTQILRQRLVIARSKPRPGDTKTGSPARLTTFDLTYEAWVDATATTDLATKWTSLRSWLVQTVNTVNDGGTVALIDEQVSFDHDDNRLSAAMSLVGISTSRILTFAESTSDVIETGTRLVPVWSGNPHAKMAFQGPATRTRTITRTGRVLTGANTRIFHGSGGGGANFMLLTSSETTTPLRLGSDDYPLDVKDLVTTEVYGYRAVATGTSPSV